MQTIKTFTLIAITLFTVTQFATAQRFVYVDTEYILEKIPDYKKAQQQIDQISEQWRKEIDSRYKEIENMYKTYQAEQVLLTDDMRNRREQEIVAKEKGVKALQKKRFGYEGELFQKRQDLVKPIQDKIYDAIKTMAETKSYDFVFDRSSGMTMLYNNPRHDKSDEILKALGYNP